MTFPSLHPSTTLATVRGEPPPGPPFGPPGPPGLAGLEGPLLAEAEGFGDAEQREAQAEERSQVAATSARTVVVERGNELRTIRAQLDEQIRTAEERVEAVAAASRARAEKALQALRAELERQRLEADVGAARPGARTGGGMAALRRPPSRTRGPARR